VAFDLRTGAPVWSYRVLGHDPWLRACGSPPAGVTWCPAESDSEKWDLGGSGANVFRIGTGHHARDVVGIGEKSGVYVVLDAKTGAFVWNTVVGTGGDQGGFEWGTAYDGTRIYGSITNQHHLPYNLTETGVVSNVTVTGGSWAALDPATGEILWQTADPQVETLPAPLGTVGVWDLAPVTSANGVVYAASMAQTGNDMYALDAATGKILWQYAAGSSVNAAPAVVDGTVYWGSGYSKSAEGSGNDKLYAFSIDGSSDTTPPTTTITASPSVPNGNNGWYTSAVGVTVTATDGTLGSGVASTRCVLDPASMPTSFVGLPNSCTLTSVGTDGKHTIYAASDDNAGNADNPVASASFKIDQTPPTISASAHWPGRRVKHGRELVVRFTCADAGAGIPAGACPPNQVLRRGRSTVSSTAETVTDAAENASAPSNVVTITPVRGHGR
jgi:outer membrane protein assembly factor BamB